MQRGSESDGQSLLVHAPSPSGDPNRTLGIWLDEHGVPSVGFGDWHSHGDVLSGRDAFPEQLAAVVDLVQAIVRDEFVLISDVGGEHGGHTSVLDLRVENALAEELTSRYSPGSVALKSWSGARDRVVHLETVVLG